LLIVGFLTGHIGNFGDVPQFPQYTIPTTPAQRRFLDERSSDIFGGYILD